MEDLDQILQHLVRMEGEILVILLVSRIASVYLLLLECLELRIRTIVFTHRSQGLVGRVVVLHQPDVGILRLVEHRLEAQGNGSAIRIVVECILRSGIVIQTSGGATTAWHIPSRTAFVFAY